MLDLDRSAVRSSRRGDLRVVTLNVWGRSGAWDARRSVLIDGLRDLRPDLVAFVEAIKTDDYDQAADLLGTGDYVSVSWQIWWFPRWWPEVRRWQELAIDNRQ